MFKLFNSTVMKKIFISITIISALFSCNNDSNKVEENITDKNTEVNSEENPIDFSELREFNLSNFDLEATIFIPESHYMVSEEEEGVEDPVVEHSDGEAIWNLHMRSNKNWDITIEDWGEEKMSIAKEKEIHKETSEVYDYNYIEEGEDFMLYQRALKSGSTTIDEKTASKLPNYHFFVVKNINGSFITIKSNDLGEFRKISAKKMLNSARTIK